VGRFTDYKEPEIIQGDTYKPIDHVGAMLVVKVKQHKEGIVTENSPDGGPGVIVDVLDLDKSEVFRDVLWMGGAMVDGLKSYAPDGLVVIKIDRRKSKSGRAYPAPVGVDAAGTARAESYYEKHGDPFPPKLQTPADDTPPWEK
jgi:hypothetical protein